VDFHAYKKPEKLKPVCENTITKVNANRVLVTGNSAEVVVTGNSAEATQGNEEIGVQLICIMPRNFITSELICVSCKILLNYINWGQDNFLLHFTVTGSVI
jgi:hypothetical protein